MISIVFIKETCYQYWPSTEKPQVYGGYNIHKDSEMNENGIIARSIMIKSNENVSIDKNTMDSYVVNNNYNYRTQT